jgi:hypothetical protein
MIMAEAFGKQESRIVDLQVGSPLTPAYAIYEGNTLSKFALFNYVDDRSGMSSLRFLCLLGTLTVMGRRERPLGCVDGDGWCAGECKGQVFPGGERGE